jgi:hypothetical protein
MDSFTLIGLTAKQAKHTKIFGGFSGQQGAQKPMQIGVRQCQGEKLGGGG